MIKTKYNKELFNKALSKIDFSISTPLKEEVLNAFNIKDIKIIILGQDPYPSLGVANGLAFAVNKDQKVPASLKQIFKEVKEAQGYIKTDRTLQHWKEEGILLLNTSLTTLVGKPNSHKEIWKEFSQDLISKLGKEKELIWILWGNQAKSYIPFIESNKIIQDAHPSPLSRKYRKGDSFIKLKEYIKIEL